MNEIHDLLLSAIQCKFSEQEHGSALALVQSYGTESHERERERVRLAVVRLSRGDLAELEYLVGCAKLDYRDVLAWERLGPVSAEEGNRLKDQARALIAQWGK